MDKQHNYNDSFKYSGTWEVSESMDLVYSFTEEVPKGVIQPKIEKSNLGAETHYLFLRTNPNIDLADFMPKWLEGCSIAGLKQVVIKLQP